MIKSWHYDSVKFSEVYLLLKKCTESRELDGLDTYTS